ncbi:hypothetical protein TPA0910_23010 [Streptomyces hygroscopicus subsp. sporocinereus]|uniref:Transposase n=1 Tax=Streptomyces hygroscopicus TaxID=1912 RepID=A0ABQ3TX64_STRHY|nr:hypothetical protein TPA0910_23010 [Streptomyces hygroscopicus]GLV78472.1 hypothetical protein Shyhy02_64720 [Streptomyces hygroscopicus subsp. hygroscopicus]
MPSCCRRSLLARQTGQRPSLTGLAQLAQTSLSYVMRFLLPRGGAAVDTGPTLREMGWFPFHCASFRPVRRAPHDSVPYPYRFRGRFGRPDGRIVNRLPPMVA